MTPPPTTAPTTTAPTSCPRTYLAPDPHRPRLTLRFAVSADHASVAGSEQVRFTPERAVTELVFRLTANTPSPQAFDHTSTVVTAATADHGGGRFTVTSAGAQAGTQGGLLHIPFAAPVAAGTTVTASIRFTLHIGKATRYAFPRVATDGPYAYFGSGAPLLAWQRGFGWHTEDLARFPAESATSEAMALDLTVQAPARDIVIASGDPVAAPAEHGVRLWRSQLVAARDVSVALGPFQEVSTKVGSVILHLGAPSARDRDALVPQFRRALTELTRRFGPYPFRTLSVARLPVAGGGIEYPSSILLLDSSRTVAVHETAHQWFYALVGDSQARHAWLDEAFAQYAEEQVDHVAGHSLDLSITRPVDAPLSSYGSDAGSYYGVTYDKGSAALEAARQAAGPAAFDRALRCYVAANAWRIAEPGDLARSLVGLPRALAVLRRAGAVR